MKEFIKSLVWVDYFFLVFTDPGKLTVLLMRDDSRALPFGFIIAASVSFMEILALSLLGKQTPYFYDKLTYGFILAFILLSLNVIIFGCLIDCVCQFMGYVGNVKQIINMLNFSLVPHMLLLPAVFIFKIFNFAPVFFHIFFTICLLFWSAMIVIHGIKEMHSISFGRASVVFVIPFIFIGMASFFSTLLIVINIIGLLSV